MPSHNNAPVNVIPQDTQPPPPPSFTQGIATENVFFCQNTNPTIVIFPIRISKSLNKNLQFTILIVRIILERIAIVRVPCYGQRPLSESYGCSEVKYMFTCVQSSPYINVQALRQLPLLGPKKPWSESHGMHERIHGIMPSH